MLTRMQTGRFKVFKSHNDWWEEFRLYHRKDGKVVFEGDDLMSNQTRADDVAVRVNKGGLRQIPPQDCLSESIDSLGVEAACFRVGWYPTTD